MDKETSQEKTSPFPIIKNTTNIKEESPRKLPLGGGGGGGGGGASNIGNNDRLKRDEWSEGAVSSLLEAYENKWALRNRAKLKGHDWEDVARYVSSRVSSTKSPKTQTQCKNKIESMKKRYRSESATTDSSSWPLYQRLDLLLRGSTTAQPTATLLPPTSSTQQVQVQAQAQAQAQAQTSIVVSTNPPLMTLLDQSPLAQVQQTPPPPLPQPPTVSPLLAPTLVVGTAQNSQGSNGVDRNAKEDGIDTRLSNQVSDKNDMDTDSSTPAIFTDKDKFKSQKLKMKMEKKKKRKRREEQNWEIADSIRWLAEVVLRSEQSRMDTMREIEKMRIAAEAKRSEMDLKRTEILAKTQMDIAKLFAGVGKGGVDSSLRIGRN